MKARHAFLGMLTIEVNCPLSPCFLSYCRYKMAMIYTGRCIYPYISDFKFRLCKVSKSFSTQGRLSTVNLPIDRVRDEKSGHHLFICLDRLVAFDPEILTNPEKCHPALQENIERLIALLKKCRGEDLSLCWCVSCRGDVLEPPDLVHQHPKHLAISRLVWFVKVRRGSMCLNHPELVHKHPTHLASSVMVWFV